MGSVGRGVVLVWGVVRVSAATAGALHRSHRSGSDCSMSPTKNLRTILVVLSSAFLAIGPLTVTASAQAVGTSATVEPTAVPPPPAPGRCGAYYIIQTWGGEAQVRECRNSAGTQIRVDGNVIDTDNDGQCAQVYASYNISTATDYSRYACPKGEREYFTFPWRNGTNAFIYLREVDV